MNWVDSGRPGDVHKEMGEGLVSSQDHIAGDPMMAKAEVMKAAITVQV